MQNPLTTARSFLNDLGPVEQAQVVASTAVVVMMVTIVATLVVTGQGWRPVDFFTILTVGLIGFTSVYFSLRHNRQLDTQRRQLLALNTIADAVNQLGDINKVLNTSLEKVTELLGCRLGWIYILEGNKLVLKCSRGTTHDFLRMVESRNLTTWLHQPKVMREKLSTRTGLIPDRLKKEGVQYWVSVPLAAKDTVAGVLIVAGNDYGMLNYAEADLMESFGKQISVALNNARLFDLLRDSEQQYHDLFENAPDSYLTIDRNHVVVACNMTMTAMVGLPKEEIIGRPFEVLFTEEQVPFLQQTIEDMFETGEGLSDVEGQIMTPEQDPVFVNLNVSFAKDDDGTIVNARVIARDITQKKKMEQTLLHAQKIDSIGQLAGGVAHDFNNILASVLGAASIMRRRLTEESNLYKYVQIIEVAARRGSSLTRQLLTFARKTETSDELVDVNSVVRETILMFERSVPKNITIATNLSEQPATVRGDSGQIQQALLNLFLNAKDAMPDGGSLTIQSSIVMVDARVTDTFAAVKPGTFVRMQVSDTGIGIDTSIKTRVFEPFFTTKNAGTGLGLSVLYGVVQNHGGFVEVESEPGRGTTFSIHVPHSSGGVRAVNEERRQTVPRGYENILIIDDEMSVCEIARDMLSELGYTVMQASDGKAGVDLYKNRRGSIDLVLLDLNMPLMGGKETFEQLRIINPNLKIIILTGYGEHAIRDRFKGEADSFLQKPFQLEDLAVKIRQVLDSRKPVTKLVG
ncbi:MAG: response regulator [Ignavibacteria bacterium]|nr:response regulator [Ignavibacteria bacterium]